MIKFESQRLPREEDGTQTTYRKYRLASVILVVLIAVGFVYDAIDNRALCRRLQSLQNALLPYRRERAVLQSEMRDLKIEYQNKMIGSATVSLIFTDISDEIYTDAYPQMQENGFVGCLALSEKNIPGENGCMSRERFDELIENGWSVCLLIDGESGVENTLPRLIEKLKLNDIAVPETIVFTKNTYRSHFDKLLFDQGFTTFVHHGEEYLPIITYDHETAADRLGSMGWNVSGANKRLKISIKYGGNMVYIIGPESAYNKEVFGRMLSKMKYYSDGGYLILTDMQSASAYHKNVEDSQEMLNEEYEEKRAVLEDKIDAVDDKMEEIYAEYGW